MTDLAKRLTETEREQRWKNQRPKDAATLILIDRAQAEPKVLVGRRHPGHKFMPGVFVFPGGRIDATDRSMPVYGTLEENTERRLMTRVQRPTLSRARALALCAIRETFEETGLMLGTRHAGAPETTPEGPWRSFAEHGVFPVLEELQFIARAITPPRRPKRFDTRFFAADASAIAHTVDGVIGPDAELVEMKWITFDEARDNTGMPTITKVVLEELEARIAAGFGAHLPVPFYQMRQGVFHRVEI